MTFEEESYTVRNEKRSERIRKKKAVFIGIATGCVVGSVIGYLTFGRYMTVYRHTDGDLPLIKADTQAFRVRPETPGGMEVPNQDKLIYERLRENDTVRVEKLLPAPEKPYFPEETSVEAPSEDDLIAQKIESAADGSLEVASTKIVDENGGLVLDENGQPQYQVVEVTETIIVVPEHENDQDIAYKYQWYKNGRKLFKETKETITIDTSKAEVAEYFCAVSQYIKNNGDGGKKSVEVVSNIVPIEVIGVNKIILHLSAGTDPTSIPLPFTPALIHVPYSLTNGWTITNIEATDQVILTDADVPNVTIECSDGIRAEFDEGLEISGNTGTVLLKWDAE